MSVANGKAYGICSCSNEEREDAPKCFVEQTDQKQLTITCKDGYSLQVSRLLERQPVDISPIRPVRKSVMTLHGCITDMRESPALSCHLPFSNLKIT